MYRWLPHFLADCKLPLGAEGDTPLPSDDFIGGGLGKWRQYISRELRVLCFPEEAVHAGDALTVGELVTTVATVAKLVNKDPFGMIPRPPSASNLSCKHFLSLFLF